MISFDRPKMLFALIVLIPALLYVFISFRRLLSNFGFLQDRALYWRVKTKFVGRTILWAWAWIFFICALSGPYWGTEMVPVQKSGRSVAFVFDVSYSMLSADMPPLDKNTEPKATRLQWAAAYASSLLKRLEGTAVSGILVKGSGILAVPLTEDFRVHYSLLNTLSPQMLSSPGSDLGAGIEAAINSFPRQSGRKSSIVLFTDGEETTGSLQNSIERALSYGISVIVLGFGDTVESQVLTGDGKTPVLTALREAQLQRMASALNAKLSRMATGLFSEGIEVLYLNARDVGSATHVLSVIAPRHLSMAQSEILTYESKRVPRFQFFLLLALGCFAAGFLLSEGRLFRKNISTVLSLFLLLTLLSCSARLESASSILSGVMAWSGQKYPKAASAFLQGEQKADEQLDSISRQYALYGLACTYLMQDELEAAESRFSTILPDAPNQVLYGMYYNRGVIAYRQGQYDQASEYFKQALLVDSHNLAAKINLELSMHREQVQSSSGRQNISPLRESADSSAVENALFSIIKEGEEQQWKSRRQETPSSTSDY